MKYTEIKETSLSSKTNKTIKNKGTGAGGANTVLNGGAYEQITSIEKLLEKKGWEKKSFETNTDYYFVKIDGNKKLVYVKQNGLKTYMEQFYSESAIRKPDEAFLIITKNENKDLINIKILEKKYQSKDGSVDVKLWAGPSLKREYELYYNEKYQVDYAFSLSKFLIDKLKSNQLKWIILNKILKENNIQTFDGTDENYFEQIYKWGFNIQPEKINNTEQNKPLKTKSKSKPVEITV